MRISFEGGAAAAVGACMAWAAGTVLTKALLDRGWDPLALLLASLASSVAVLWTCATLLGRAPPLRSFWRLGWPGLAQPALSYGLAIHGLALTSATVETLLFTAETSLIILLAWPVLGERPDRRALAAAGLAAFGVFMVAGGGEAADDALRSWLGPVLILTGVAAAAVHTVLLRRIAGGGADDPLAFVTAQQIVGTGAVGLFWLIWTGFQSGVAAPTLAEAGLIGAAGVLLHGLPFVLFAAALGRMSAGAAGLFLPLVPILTAALAYVFLGDRLTIMQICGGALVLATVFYASRLRQPET